jgi:D-glycero-D-manno-heptose 1,7-bisphosphate phosphatase
MTRPALLCDRDGTLIHDAHYLHDPAQVRLLPGAAEMLRAFRDAGWALVVITNQAGSARGLITEAQYQSVRARLDALLADEGVTLDGSLHCPHHPDFTGPCRCRKPGTLLHEQARDQRHLDLARSVWIGDRWHDIAPASVFGGRGILIPSPDSPADEIARAEREAEVAQSRDEIVTRVLGTS